MKLVNIVKEKALTNVFTDIFLKSVISGTDDSRFSLVKRWIKEGEIVHLKRGFYALGEKNRKNGINMFQVAQILYGPSYISLESALSYHGWIPEAVYAVTSVTSKRATDIKTPLGFFSYTPVHAQNFFSGVDRIEDENGVFLMASPWRAIADYVYVYRKDWKSLQPLEESLRIDPENFKTADIKTLDMIYDSMLNKRVRVFFEKIRKELMA